MRKSPNWRGEQVFSVFFRSLLLALIFTCQVYSSALQSPAPNTEPTYETLVESQIERLKAEVERTGALVANGTLPRTRLDEAEERLADARDEEILAGTLYNPTPIGNVSEADAKMRVDSMLAAAQRRVDRQNAAVEQRRTLLNNGVISQSEFETVSAALEARRQVLVLAQNRAKLLDDIRHMAEAEKLAEHAAALKTGTLANSMIRYSGNGAFSLADVPAISSQFERRFHRALPVSALGQTSLHQSLGLDHRNRVDVALSPDSNEGMWLRNLLEKLRVPYLAFTSAVTGAATAPHIHIGIESTRLKPGSGR